MGATWKSWRTTSTVIIVLLQIQAPISVNTTAVSGVEGMKFEFKCKYVDGLQKNPKFFCRDDNGDKMSFTSLIRTQKHDQWEKSGRFSLYDNTSGAFFVVRVDALTSEDSGTYRCGVDVSLRPDHVTFIGLNVSRANPPDNLTNHSTKSSVFPATVNKFHASLLVTAATCVAALLFICLFTFCLLLAVRLRRPAPQPNREASSDYETMMPGVTTEPELSCSSSVPDCDDLLVLPAAAAPPPPPPPPDCCSHFTSKHRESTESLGLGDYVGPKPIDPYQHLDLSQLEEHVYHSLNGPLGVNKHINCC